MNRIWLSPPDIGKEEQSFVKRAFDTNWIAPVGENVNRFERSIAEFVSAKSSVVLSSGTASIHLALKVLGIKQGDEVLVSTFTFVATVNPVLYEKAVPVFVESESRSWNMCPDTLEEAIVDRRKQTGRVPKAIVVVHTYGMPANIKKILSIATKYNIPVVEDAAEALGSKYEGQFLGTFGVVGIFSFNGNKIITTSSGGALVSNFEDLLKKAKYLSSQSKDLDSEYLHHSIGYNYQMSNVLAGIGLGQMTVLNHHIEKRREVHQFYQDVLRNSDRFHLFEEPDESYYSNHWLSCITISKQAKLQKEELKEVFANHNIETRSVWRPLHTQPFLRDCPYYGNRFSETLFSQGLCLPSGSALTFVELERIASVLETSTHPCVAL